MVTKGAGGRHTVFLGMAPGVGKTYQMLEEGREEENRGREVVIGYLEPHGGPKRWHRPLGWRPFRDDASNTARHSRRWTYRAFSGVDRTCA